MTGTDPSSPELKNAVGAFAKIAEIVYAGSSTDEVYHALCQAAVDSVDGCDHASLMLRRSGGQVVTAAASDEIARMADNLERELGTGPCLDAIEEESADLDADLAIAPRWPELSARLLAETPVRGMAGFRLALEGRKVGALNMFSDRPGALTDASVDQGVVLAAFVSIAFAALERGGQAESLRRGLSSNREIGKAVGLLMARHGIDDDSAFAMLVETSQHMNVKLAEVAASVVREHRGF